MLIYSTFYLSQMDVLHSKLEANVCYLLFKCLEIKENVTAKHLGLHDLCTKRLNIFNETFSKLVSKPCNIHYITKSIGTPSNERFDYFSNFHEYKS